jgi:hypothetical protein
MINYTSWPIILLNMKTIKPTTSEELRSQDITILKMHENVKVPKPLQQLSNQNGGISWSTWTIIRGVAFTKW